MLTANQLLRKKRLKHKARNKVTDLENNKRDKDSISSTAKSNVRPFSDNNINTHRF